MKDGLPWRERRRRRGVATAAPTPKEKIPCYLVSLTNDYQPADEHGISRPYYIVNETQEKRIWSELPPGAMYVDPDFGPKVKLPDNETWYIDSQCSNCTRPGDTNHRCWIRHGEPPKLTVNKDGNTCDAGAGSIATKGYHGFLRDGFLVRC